MDKAVVFSIFGAMLVICAWILSFVPRSTSGKVERRLDELSRDRSAQKLADFAVGTALPTSGHFLLVTQRMWQAGIYTPLHEFALLELLLGVAGYLAGKFFFKNDLAGAAAGLLAAAMPFIYIEVRRRQRFYRFGQQLPDVLDLIKSALEAGHTLLRSLQVVAEEFPAPASTEFRIVVEQVRVGVSLVAALEQMLSRVDDEGLQFLVVAAQIQREMGTSLAEIIENLAGTIRSRIKIEQQLRSMTTQSRFSGIVVALMPVFVLAMFSAVSGTYVHTLFVTAVGRAILISALIMDITALLWVRQIIKVRF